MGIRVSVCGLWNSVHLFEALEDGQEEEEERL